MRLPGWFFGLLVLAIGIANLLLIHPVPAAGYLLVSLVYLPPTSALLASRTGWLIHPAAKPALGIVVVMLTLGVSDLGEMLD
ncbi:MAG: hypothetical protein M3Q40_10710 [Pseudomonadota bacterium]|nr:hypothetical protein [Pseudomonadota bacterium]